MTIIKLCNSIIRKNKGFTICIFVMSILSIAIGFLGANFGASSNETIMGFIENSGTPDAVYVTELLPNDTAKAIEEIDGVRRVDSRFVFDANIKTKDGEVFSVRVFACDEESLFKQTIHEDLKDTQEGQRILLSSKLYNGNGILISNKFAEYNGIHAGDKITIETSAGSIETFVRSIVSNPETISCSKDEMSLYESHQFAYVYIDAQYLFLFTAGPNLYYENPISFVDYSDYVPYELFNQSNEWLVYFDEGLSVEEQKACMKKIISKLEGKLVSETLTSESDALNEVRDDLSTISVLCNFIPGIIWLIGLGFNFIFIKIIVENQRRTIGLLRALGFSIGKVVWVFVVYTIIINIPALILGTVAGYKLLDFCVNLIASSEGIIEAEIVINPALTTVMLLMAFVIGIVAALLSSRTITKIDPSKAYDLVDDSNFEPSEFIGKLHFKSFLKISVSSIMRNYKRQIVGALCICACIISMCVGFEGVLTIGHPIDAVFGGRYKYDLIVRDLNKEAINRIRSEVDGVALVEETTMFSSKLFGENVRVATIGESDTLTEVINANSEKLYPEEGVIIDEMCAEINSVCVGDVIKIDDNYLLVKGIAREILYPVLYISNDTAQLFGYDEPNCALLKLDENADIKSVKEKIANISKDAYFVEFASQKESIRSGFVPMRTIMFVFAVLAFFIGSLLVINITIIDFNENRIKYATLRAIGTPIKKIGIIPVIMNLIRIVVGIILAIPLCYICTNILLGLLSGATQQYVMVRYWECFGVSCLITLLYVLIGMCISQYKIKKMDFCSCLNEME